MNKKTYEIISIVTGLLFFISLIANLLSKKDAMVDQNILFTAISGILLFTSLFITLTLTIYEFKKIVKDFTSFKDNMIKDVREETIKMVSHLPLTATTMLNDTKREFFINNIYKKFANSLTDISNGKITEDDPFLYHDFAISLFNLVKNGGHIIASSNVNPQGFWEDATINKYLNNNKELILNRGITFDRYFFIDDENKEVSKKAIAKNIHIGTNVFVIDKSRVSKTIIKDGGRIDDVVCIESVLDDNTFEILKVKAYFKGNNNYDQLSRIIDDWKAIGIEATVFYGMTKEEFIKLLEN